MGRLIYDSTLTIFFDDRTLAHLQAVFSSKLQHKESFNFAWRDEAGAGTGSGRNVIWVHPGVALVYSFTSSRRQQLNPDWISALMGAANATDGLSIVPEPSSTLVGKTLSVLPPARVAPHERREAPGGAGT